MTRETFSGLIRENHATLTANARVITGGVKAGSIVQSTLVTAWPLKEPTSELLARLHGKP